MGPQPHLLLAAAILLSAVRLTSAEPPPDISKGWKFKLGDNGSWSAPALDDSDWLPIRAGISWEKQGFADYDGYAWYRLHIDIPASLRKAPSFGRHQSLSVTLGKIDDVDQTWFNGKVIGTTGEFPDSYRPAWQTTRVYRIPAALIRWDADNVLAVRVYDGKGTGGMVEGACRLAVTTLGDLVQLAFDLGRGDGVFSDQQGMPISAKVRNEARVEVVGKVNWTVKDDEGSIVSKETVAAKIPPHGESRIACRFAPTRPGFYRVSCSVECAQKGVIASTTMTLGYRPEEIKSALTRQADFDEFWRKTLAALDAVEPQFKMVRQPAMDSKTHEVYEVQMHSLGGVRVGGWYEKPLAEGTHPAVLRVPGYGGNMRPSGSSHPMALFSFNVRGHGNSQDDVRGTPRDYWIRGLDDKQGYYYQGAYADCVRAVDFLAWRPEVDAGRMAVTGGSQGGGLSLVTAALDHRISLCAPDIPFLCDWVKYFKATDWPELNAWVDAQPHRSWETTLRTLSYFDALNFADRIRCPVLLGLGLQDNVCPPATIFAVYNRLAGPKEYRAYPHARHWVDTSHNDERGNWMREHFQRENHGIEENARKALLVDKHATAQTQELFLLLRRLAETRLLFGHQDSTAYGVGWSSGREKSDVKEVTGSFPAVYGWDVGRLGGARNLDRVDFGRIKQLIKDAHTRGGINTISWHMSNPVTGRGYLDRTARANNVSSVIPGGSHHEHLKRKLDAFAEFVSELKDTGGRPIPIVFRPWHENNQPRFWWAATGDGQDYVALWRFTVEYLRDKNKVHNLLYAYSPLARPFLRSTDRAVYTSPRSGYPGDAYVDVIGIDDYSGNGESILAGARLIVDVADARHKIAALTEVGPGSGLAADRAISFYTGQLLQPIKGDAVARKIAYALVWRNSSSGHFWVPHKGHPDAEDFIAFFKDPFTAFEDDLARIRAGQQRQ